MRYRQAVEGDMRELAEMRWEFHYEDEPDSPEERRSEFVRECESFLREGLLGGRWVVWLAEDGNEIVAHACVHRLRPIPRPDDLDGEYGYLTNVYARPAHRNRGVGIRLMDEVVAWARGVGLDLLFVWPSERSVPFYERAGFAADDERMMLELTEE